MRLGLFLTTADAGKNEITVTGPTGVSVYWSLTGYFMHRADLRVDIFEVNESYLERKYPDFVVKCIPVFGNCTTAHSRSKICYVCEFPKQPGKFDLSKAKSLDIPKGPLYSSLKSGNSVTLPDGRVIRPEEVLGPGHPSTSILIICKIDSGEMIPSLTSQDWERCVMYACNLLLREDLVRLIIRPYSPTLGITKL